MMPSTAHCPACGGEIHPLAGRCKYCKADLARLRSQESVARPAAPAASDESGPNQALAMLAAPPPSRQHPDRPSPAPGPPPPGPAPRPGQPPAVVQTPPVVQSPAPPPMTPAPAPSAPAYRPQPPSQPHPAPYPPSSWARRWPLAVGAVAILAIGISLGILIERSRQSAPEPVRSRSGGSSPRPTLDFMPDPGVP